MSQDPAAPKPEPFWKTKTLAQMNKTEWESLCDGCGLCCLLRFEIENTAEIIPTRVHCKMFNSDTCQCTDYPNRKIHVPDCIELSPTNIEGLLWMPKSCAYRRLFEGKDLPNWHPLVTGDRNSPHKAGVSIRNQTVSEAALFDEEAALDFPAYDLLEDRSDKPYP